MADKSLKTDAQAVKRVRLTVPPEDETVLRWMARQSNLSVSIRQVIRESVAQYGYNDVTCVSVRGRGRPRVRDEFDARYDGEETREQEEERLDGRDAVREEAPVAPEPVAEPGTVPVGLPEDLQEMLK